jgi:hypothetical protein
MTAQANHRRSIERIVIEGDSRRAYIGQFMAFALAAGALTISGWLIHEGRDVSGIIALIAGLGAVVVPFLQGKARLQKQQEDNRRRLSSS